MKYGHRYSTLAVKVPARVPGARRKADPDSLHSKALAAGLPYIQVYFRVKRLGWTEEKALSTPIKFRRPNGSPPESEIAKAERQLAAIKASATSEPSLAVPYSAA
jgi:hypothetical protein